MGVRSAAGVLRSLLVHVCADPAPAPLASHTPRSNPSHQNLATRHPHPSAHPVIPTLDPLNPSGVEFAGELVDFLHRDIRRLYPDRARDVKVSLVEGREILGSFDLRLREYAAQRLTRQGVQLRKVGHSGGARCTRAGLLRSV